MQLRHSHISLHGMRFHAFHGVMAQENIVGADFIVDLQATYDATAAMLTDDVAHAVNYATLYDIVKQEMAQPSKLIEHVAWRIAHHIANACPPVTHIDITLTKCNPPMGADLQGASVTLHIDTTPTDTLPQPTQLINSQS